MKQLMLILVLATSLVACSATSDELVSTSYKSMQTTATLAAAVLSAANDLHDQGLVTDESYIKVLQAAQTFDDAYKATVDILYAYDANKDETGKAKLLAQLDLLKSSVAVLFTIAENLGVNLSNVDTTVIDTVVVDEAA